MMLFFVINGFTYWYFKPKKSYVVESTKEVILPIQNIEIDNQNNSIDYKVLSIKNFIGKQYTNSDLSILDVQKGTGFNQRELNAIFKSEFQSTFNNYLNLIRITEVKRLLIHTNLSVSEIAYNCGYNQVPHFNRVFKKETGLSPKEFREQFSDKKSANLG
jgi:AraC-like DNA-binding protein